MLRTLDPHSNFFDPKEFCRSARRATRYVLRHWYVHRRAAAHRQANGGRIRSAELRPTGLAFVLATCWSKSMTRRVDKLTTSEVAEMLKGPKGTKVQVIVAVKAPPSRSRSIWFATRFHATASGQAFWLKPGIAYMRIEQFTETTSKEVEDNLKALG